MALLKASAICHPRLRGERFTRTAQSDSFVPVLSRLFSRSPPYAVKVGIPEFLRWIGGGIEAHVAKLESEIGDFKQVARFLHAQAQEARHYLQTEEVDIEVHPQTYVGLWRPRAEPVKA
ncbi:hypothetical protein NL676_020045 [Syzygium grande]|nr:hypothetical protein NL676_020045 [Syzygium grande]